MAILYCHWHVLVKNGNFTLLLTSSGQEWQFCHEIDRKTFIFRVNLGIWPLNWLSQKNEPCSEGFNTYLWCFQGHRWENVQFSTKPRHVTPQIDHLRKMTPVLRISTHIYGVSQEIEGKTFFFRVNLVFNCHHFVTDHLQEYVQFTIYHV